MWYQLQRLCSAKQDERMNMHGVLASLEEEMTVAYLKVLYWPAFGTTQ
jgi:hypothetical protein